MYKHFKLRTNFCIPTSEQKLTVWVAAFHVFQSKKANPKCAILLMELVFSSVLNLKKKCMFSKRFGLKLETLWATSCFVPTEKVAVLIIARIVLWWIQNVFTPSFLAKDKSLCKNTFNRFISRKLCLNFIHYSVYNEWLKRWKIL